MRHGLFVLLFLTARLRADAILHLLEPEILAEGAVIHARTRNFHPSLGDQLLIQVARDSKFTVDVHSRFSTLETVFFGNLMEGGYYARARVLDVEGEPLSSWSEAIRFEWSGAPPKPSLLVLEDQPIWGDVLTVVWPPCDGAEGWEVRVSKDADFEETMSSVTKAPMVEVDLRAWRGLGEIWVKVRALRKDEPGPWSDPVGVTYDRPQWFEYSLAHIPASRAWEAWLHLETAEPAPTELTLHYKDGGELGAVVEARMFLDGQTPRRVRLTDITRGGPMLIRSDAPLIASLHYEGPDLTAGGYQVNRFTHARELALTGLRESVGSDVFMHGAIVAANQSEEPMETTLILEVWDRVSGEWVEGAAAMFSLEPMGHQVFMVEDFFPSSKGEAMDWTVTVRATADRPGLDLVGADFVFNHECVSGSWRQGAPQY